MKVHNIIIALLAAVALTSCTQSGNAPEDGHDHDEHLQLTAYNNNFEVFAEVEPFVAGQSSDITAHFSLLKNFKPMTAGSVTASLIIETDGIRQRLEQPTRPGVYVFSLQPAAAGNGKLIFDIETEEGTSQIVVPNISVYADAHEAQHAAIAAAVNNSNAAVFSKEQSWKVDFATEEVRRKDFGQIIRITAQIQPSQGDERVITAKMGGMVLFSNGDVVEGKAVGAGQTLFSIDGSGMAADNISVRFTEAESEYNRAKTEYERKRELAKENIVSQSDLLKAKTDFTNAEANYLNLKGNFSAGKQIVSSPISGYITRVLVRNGEYAQAGQPVLVVSQNRDLFIKAELPPKYFDRLGNITSANFRLLNSNRTYTLEELNGRLLSYGKSADINMPLISVVFQVQNKADFLAGSFVETFIKTQTSAQTLTVSNESIVEEMGNYFVYVQLTPELFEKRAVKKGVTDGLRTEIAEGISAGERVVSKGAVLVKLAQAAGTVDAHSGHAH
ncbi:MAG: efflux RND transporter periplasmic adaptor subunit [Bacteroidales bacterium]|nr:efflux RND transporter periplasmic adaptor subunit [Bacteroidales bacterium]